jgi:hypothetical protein
MYCCMVACGGNSAGRGVHCRVARNQVAGRGRGVLQCSAGMLGHVDGEEWRNVESSFLN